MPRKKTEAGSRSSVNFFNFLQNWSDSDKVMLKFKCWKQNWTSIECSVWLMLLVCFISVWALNRTDLSWTWLGLWALPEESQPAHTVRSAPTRGDTLDKLNSDKSACQYDLNHGRYFLSASCHIASPAGLALSATWLLKKRGMMKEWEVSVTGLTRGRKRTSFD